MNALTSVRKRAMALVLLLAAAALVWFGAVFPYLEALSRSQQQLGAAVSQLHMYQRAIARGVADDTGKNDTLAALLFPGASSAAAAAYLQQHMGAATADAGALLLSFELLPPAVTEDTSLQTITGRIRLTANTQSLRALLHALESFRPPLALDNVFVRARSDQDTVPGGHLDVQIDVSGFRQATP